MQENGNSIDYSPVITMLLTLVGERCNVSQNRGDGSNRNDSDILTLLLQEYFANFEMSFTRTRYYDNFLISRTKIFPEIVPVHNKIQINHLLTSISHPNKSIKLFCYSV